MTTPSDCLVQELEDHGLVDACSDRDALCKRLAEGPLTLYCGFDPTADSLHLGHMVQIMLLMRFQRRGHQPIALVGGATGMVGDPSGKSEERNLLSVAELDRNVEAIREQLGRFLEFDSNERHAAILANNADWLGRMDLIQFLRDVGKHFSVNVMMAKDSVKKRMETGISFTEFTYQILQSYDFFHLHREFGCALQVGGSDQWGNITAGIDFVRRKIGESGNAFGLTTPLVLQSSGEKFGKTAKGAVWLDARKTSPYEFFQYFMNRDDRDLGVQLRTFTFLPLAEIQAIVSAHEQQPERREGQRRLATEVTRLVHGESGLNLAEKVTNLFFPKKGAAEASWHDFTDEELLPIFKDVPSASFPRARLSEEGVSLLDALVACGLTKSKGEGRRLWQQGGIAVNNVKVVPEGGTTDTLLKDADLASESCIILRKGAKSYAVVRVE